jgi:hypothetical protein
VALDDQQRLNLAPVQHPVRLPEKADARLFVTNIT